MSYRVTRRTSEAATTIQKSFRGWITRDHSFFVLASWERAPELTEVGELGKIIKELRKDLRVAHQLADFWRRTALVGC